MIQVALRLREPRFVAARDLLCPMTSTTCHSEQRPSDLFRSLNLKEGKCGWMNSPSQLLDNQFRVPGGSRCPSKNQADLSSIPSPRTNSGSELRMTTGANHHLIVYLPEFAALMTNVEVSLLENSAGECIHSMKQSFAAPDNMAQPCTIWVVNGSALSTCIE